MAAAVKEVHLLGGHVELCKMLRAMAGNAPSMYTARSMAANTLAGRPHDFLDFGMFALAKMDSACGA